MIFGIIRNVMDLTHFPPSSVVTWEEIVNVCAQPLKASTAPVLKRESVPSGGKTTSAVSHSPLFRST